MADNLVVTAGSGTTLLADEVTEGTLGTGLTGITKIMDGTIGGTTMAAVGGGVEAGALRVTLASDSTGVVSIDDNGGTLTVDGTVTANLSATDNAVLDTIDAVLDTINAKLVTGTVIGDVNLGATDNAVLDSIDSATTAIQTAVELIDNAISGTEMQVDVVAALPAGTNAIGKLAANTGVDIGDVDVTSISAGSNLIGDVGIQGRTTGGLSVYYDADLDETAVAAKASAGTIYGITAFNTTAAPLFLQIFNVAQGSVTVGTTTPTEQYVIPANADSDGAGFTYNIPQGIAYGTAITVACSTDSEGNGAPGVGACIVNLHYK